jgi:Pyruvate/2-oxoacid:ferredoxin oxidoreductase delta subunit
LYDLAAHLRLEHESAYNNIDSNTISATRGEYKVNFQTIYENGVIIIKCNDCTYFCKGDTINPLVINKHAETHQNKPINKGLKGKGLRELNEDVGVAFGYYTINI